ncbi:hypothetical protein DFH06DRAFT_1422926 [Mycena polygramma]|nr:hypothetical protein DFH06DRAFT_1422926 [Mycena polygramma]
MDGLPTDTRFIMLTFFNKKACRALPTPSPTSTPAPTDPSAPRSALKALRLVDKLVAARVIDRLLPKKKRGPAKEDSPNARKVSRPSPIQTTTVQKRAPFVVPLRVSTGRSATARPTPSRGSKVPVRRPVRPLDHSAPKSVTPAVSRIPKANPGPRHCPAPAAPKTGKKPCARSRIPVRVSEVAINNFVKESLASPRIPVRGRLSTNTSSPPRTNGPAPAPQFPRRSSRVRLKIPVFVSLTSTDPLSAPSPRTSRISQATPSRIPRLKRTAAPFVSPRGSIINIGLQTPCPSHTLVVGARQSARKAKATKVEARTNLKTVETASGSKNVQAGAVRKMSKDAEVDVVGKNVKGEDAAKRPEEASARTQDEPQVMPEQQEDTGDKRSIPNSQDARTPGSAMESFLLHLKNRLSWATKSATSTPTPPSPTKGVFVIVNNPGRGRLAQENIEVPSELHQAFARRAAALSKLSSNVNDEPVTTKEPRRPLAPLHGFSNMIGRRGPAPTTNTPPCATVHVLAQELPVVPLLNRDLDQPGADLTVTELVTTPFGIRKVRRTLFPSIPEGTLASRNPQIVIELDRLRAQQKVGSLVSKK